MRLDPVSLKLFVAVAEAGSIAGAAVREHIAAAAVSKRMSELESLLGTALLRRTNKGVEPTAAGLALLQHARRLAQQLDEIALDMREWTGGTRGQVRVHANISAITQTLPAELAAFLAQWPQVQVHLREHISSVIVKAVAENEADVGIGVVSAQGTDLEVLPYRSDRLALIVPSGHPLAGQPSVCFADAVGFDWVGLHTGSAINLLLGRAAADADASLRVRMQVTSYDALSRMVAAGLGIGAMPERVAREYGATLGIGVVGIEDDWARRELKLCVRSYDGLATAARLLVDSLVSPPRYAQPWQPPPSEPAPS